MSVPIVWFLLAWFVLIGFFVLFSLITLIQTTRHGIGSPLMYASTFAFVAVAAFVIVGCGVYFLRMDWKANVDILPTSFASFLPGGMPSVRDIPLN